MKKVLFWTLAVLVTFSAIIYQRKTGPTYDKKVNINIEGTEYDFKLVRSHGGESDCPVVLYVPDKTITGELLYRIFPTNNEWTAFGEAWAGVPFAFIFWLLALLMNRKKERPAYTVVAAVVMLIVYSIPHSMYGSQLDPETGEIIQGWM